MSKSGTPLPVIELETYPPVETWDDVTDLDPAAWPRQVERHSMLVPTTCFNCEAGCGLMAWIDPETQKIRKLEGNPHHPGSRGHNCAKGPATLNQVEDPDRILYPLKRVGERGSGQFERVTWDQVLDDLAGRMRTALLEEHASIRVSNRPQEGIQGCFIEIEKLTVGAGPVVNAEN